MIGSTPAGHDNINLAAKGTQMRISLGFGIAVVAIYVGTAGADEFKPPPMKDGLWEAHNVQTSGGKNLSDMTIKMCMSKALTQSNDSFAEQMRKTNQCTSTIVQQSGNMVTEESRCAKGPNAGEVTRGVFSHVGDTATHIEMHMHIRGAETVTVADMKYLGSCPAGMKAGDVIMPNGKVVGGP
jgi:Protein of unknown function (DUF3617)